MQKSWVRRPLITTAIALMALVLIVLSPIWVVGLSVFDLVRGRLRFPLVRFTAFGVCWAVLETAGVLHALWLWITGRGRNIDANYSLQTWWTTRLIDALRYTLGVKFTVEGIDNLGTGPFVALCRHASLADSIMSAWVVASHAGLRPRYVLKKELMMDPCLDILGHRLPNYFIDRESPDIAAELVGIEQMADHLMPGDCCVIFPEGSRASTPKREKSLQRLRERAPERAARLEGLKYLIAPKPAGANALLAAVPEAKVLTMWHSGFDGFDTFKGILRHLGSARARIHVKVEEHKRETIGTGEQFVSWLDKQWVEMDKAVARQIAIDSHV